MSLSGKIAHLSTGVNVAATAGGFTVTDAGALFPRAEVSSVVLADGRRAVDVMLVGTLDGGLTFTPAEARAFAAALIERADAP
jgi:hypothetical protein